MDLMISEFNGEVQQRILDRMNTAYLSTGKFFNDQMNVSPKIMSALILSGGVVGTSVSSAMSSTLFMATANPDVLMKIGTGVGSAVMGTQGIVAQAAFIPVASSIPVVAPLMAMHALSSVAMLQQFGAIDKKLDAIKETIDIMLERQELTEIAKLLVAVQMVDELYMQYKQAGYFSTDMLMRLALAERDTAIISKRYEMLSKTMQSKSNFADSDAHCTMLASFLNLRVKFLRTSVDAQENPQSVHHSTDRFMSSLKNSISLWDVLLHKSDGLKEKMDKLSDEISKEKPVRNVLGSKRKELDRITKDYNAAVKRERDIGQDFYSLIDMARQLSEVSSAIPPPTLLYWHDNEGEHCIATNEHIID